MWKGTLKPEAIWHDISSSGVLVICIYGSTMFFVAYNITYLIVLGIALFSPTNTKANANTASETWL